MTDIKLPAAVVEAAAREIAQHDGWGFQWTAYEETARAALLAGLKAWPGMFGTELEDHTGVYRKIILPLPQETDND